jgi:hypothetical protein
MKDRPSHSTEKESIADAQCFRSETSGTALNLLRVDREQTSKTETQRLRHLQAPPVLMSKR